MANKKREKRHEEEANESWLLPYSDLMTLMLAVFIVLFAVSQIDAGKAQMVSDQFTDSMRTDTYGVELQNLKTEARENIEMENQSDLKEVKEKIDAKLEAANMTSFATTDIDERGLVIRLSNAILFDPGSARIKPEYEQAMRDIGVIIGAIDNYVRVEGHTDNVPQSSEAFPSNWELSGGRAAGVVRLFIEASQASPDKFQGVGYGEYRPIADNATEEGRAKNRRIDVIVLSGQFFEQEKDGDPNRQKEKTDDTDAQKSKD